jgi:hypothetical protein
MTIFEFLRGKLRGEPALHPIDRRIAKRWVKQRLKHLYPELRLDPKALEQAYQELGIEPHAGIGRGAPPIFEITLPGGQK